MPRRLRRRVYCLSTNGRSANGLPTDWLMSNVMAGNTRGEQSVGAWLKNCGGSARIWKRPGSRSPNHSRPYQP
ncbi:MAG: hypothetical protein MI757_03335 [Pirellulales bacterium]|nr:hypothetical protein [Pirellulales bacterium]